jgi:hypothetical protein
MDALTVSEVMAKSRFLSNTGERRCEVRVFARESTLLSKRKNSTSDPQPEVIATGTLRSCEKAQPKYLRPGYDLSQFQHDQELLARTRASIDESLELIARVNKILIQVP